jgi:hypothetical protein
MTPPRAPYIPAYRRPPRRDQPFYGEEYAAWQDRMDHEANVADDDRKTPKEDE